MGCATIKVGGAVRSSLYDEAASFSPRVYVLKDTPFGDGTHQLEITSDLLPPGENGQQEIIIEPDGGYRFKKYQCDFAEC